MSTYSKAPQERVPEQIGQEEAVTELTQHFDMWLHGGAVDRRGDKATATVTSILAVTINITGYE